MHGNSPRERLAGGVQRVPVEVKLAPDGRGGRMRIDHPRVADVRGALDRPVVVGRDPHRRRRPLHRPDVHPHPIEPARLAVVRHRIFGPQPVHELQVFHHARDALALRHVEGVELDVAIAESDAEHEVPPGDDVERRHGLGHVHRVVQVEQQDPEAGGHLAGLRNQPGDERHDLELLVVAFVQVVLPREQRVPAAVAGVVHHRDLVPERAHHVGVEVLLVGEKESDLH